MTITWDASIETGISQIDLQHKQLVEMINKLETAHKLGQDELVLKELLPRLTSYLLFHFNDEESVAEEIGADIQHTKRHIAEHKKFTEKINGLTFYNPEEVHEAVADLITFLEYWFIEHIMKTDKQLAAIFHAYHEGTTRR